MSREEQFDFYWKEIFDGLPYNPIEFNVYRFDQSMSLPGKFNKLYEMFKQLALNNQEVMDYLKEFMETFDFKLETTIKDILIVWLNEGLLADVVREAINDEVIEARTDYLGKQYVDLKERLDSEKADIVEVTAQLAETVNYKSFKNYGAIGDGIADDTVAIENALNSGQPILGDSGETYKITRTVVVKSDVWLKSSRDEPFYFKPDGPFQAFSFANDVHATTTLTQDTFMNKNQIRVQEPLINKGDLINLKSSTLWYYNNRNSLYKGETQLVKSVNGNTLTLDGRTWDTYKVASELVTIKAVKPITVVLENFEINYDVPSSCLALVLSYTHKSRLNNIRITNAKVTGISLANCYDTVLTNIAIDGNDEGGTGYGIQDNGSTFTSIYNSKVTNGTTGIDFSGTTPSRGGLVKDCLSIGQKYAYSTHGTAEHIVFENNTLMDAIIGFALRGGNITVRNNTLIGKVDYGVTISDGTNNTIENNVYTNNMTGKDITGTPNALPGQMLVFAQLNSQDLIGKFIFRGNKVDGIRRGFIQIGDIRTFENLLCENNVINLQPESVLSSVNFIYHGYSGTTIKKSTILNNNITVLRGVYEKLEDVVIVDFDTCFFDDIKFNVGDNLEVWAGIGVLTNKISEIVVNRNKDITRINGYLKFDVTADTVVLRLSNLPIHGNNDESTWLYIGGLFRQGVLKFHKGVFADQKRIYISNNTTDYNGVFPIGDGYYIPLNISYKTA